MVPRVDEVSPHRRPEAAFGRQDAVHGVVPAHYRFDSGNSRAAGSRAGSRSLFGPVVRRFASTVRNPCWHVPMGIDELGADTRAIPAVGSTRSEASNRPEIHRFRPMRFSGTIRPWPTDLPESLPILAVSGDNWFPKGAQAVRKPTSWSSTMAALCRSFVPTKARPERARLPLCRERPSRSSVTPRTSKRRYYSPGPESRPERHASHPCVTSLLCGPPRSIQDSVDRLLRLGDLLLAEHLSQITLDDDA